MQSKSEWVDDIVQEIIRRTILDSEKDEHQCLFNAVADALPEDMVPTFIRLIDLKDNTMFQAISLTAEVAPVVKHKFGMKPARTQAARAEVLVQELASRNDEMKRKPRSQLQSLLLRILVRWRSLGALALWLTRPGTSLYSWLSRH